MLIRVVRSPGAAASASEWRFIERPSSEFMLYVLLLIGRIAHNDLDAQSPGITMGQHLRDGGVQSESCSVLRDELASEGRWQKPELATVGAQYRHRVPVVLIVAIVLDPHRLSLDTATDRLLATFERNSDDSADE